MAILAKGAGLNNALLQTLAPEMSLLLAPHLVAMDLRRGAVLFEPGDDVTHAFFPCGRTMVSFVIAMSDGRAAEAGLIGREGAVGGIISLGGKPAFTRAVVQSEGRAFRIKVKILDETRNLYAPIRELFANYADCLLAQVLQSVACNALHEIEQRCCRWLLLAQDRFAADELPFTHEFLSEMLGVQRTTVTEVMRSLQNRRILSYRRGIVTVLDRQRMTQASCECYTAVRNHFERVAPGLYPNS